MTFELLVTFLSRLALVLLFLPFSALDKVLNFSDACEQGSQAVRSRGLAAAMILTGLFIEIVMSAGVLSGVADRLAAVLLAGYCMATAVLFKQFWKTPDFRLKGKSKGREVFWDFLKNFAVAGGFLCIAFGPGTGGVASLLANPFSSTHPYSTTIGVQP